VAAAFSSALVNQICLKEDVDKSCEGIWLSFSQYRDTQRDCHSERSEESAFSALPGTADSSRQNRALGMTILAGYNAVALTTHVTMICDPQ
jgi:hypothetical protein